MRVATDERVGIWRSTIESTGCGYETACIGKQRRKFLYLCQNGVPIVVNAVIMTKWGIDTVLVGIAESCLWLGLMGPGEQQEVVFWP